MTDWGKLAQTRLNRIAQCSEGGPGVTRLPFTPEHRAALSQIRDWMKAAGCAVRMDAAGTLIGRKGPDDAPTLLIGSHQDSVRQGGAFDGIMGVALGCLALETLAADGLTLPFAVEILAFADEEGVRFPTALLGSRALAGTLDPAIFEMTDAAGVRLGTALTEFGGDPAAALTLARAPQTVLGYLELHIEQGPALEAADTPLGVVTAISGIERHSVTITGEAGHAGTVPMPLRRDALVAAAEVIATVNRVAHVADIRATVGELHLRPNAVNAIPAEVRLVIEIRAPRDDARAAAGITITRALDRIAQDTRTEITAQRSYAQPAMACDPDLRAGLVRAVAQVAGDAPELPSGATHDASAMADLCPMAMLFTRCKAGISHNPAEYASAGDMGLAVAALARFLRDYAPAN